MNSYYLNKLADKAKENSSARFRLIEEIWYLEEHGYKVFRDKQLHLLLVKERCDQFES